MKKLFYYIPSVETGFLKKPESVKDIMKINKGRKPLSLALLYINQDTEPWWVKRAAKHLLENGIRSIIITDDSFLYWQVRRFKQ